MSLSVCACCPFVDVCVSLSVHVVLFAGSAERTPLQRDKYSCIHDKLTCLTAVIQSLAGNQLLQQGNGLSTK